MKISGAESVVMDALWRRSPRTAEDVAAEVAGPQGWTEATVKTLINRLLKKKAVEAEREGRRYLYRPRLAREAWLAAESETVVDRLFGGRVAPLVSHFSKSGRLTPEDVAELKRLIAEIEE
ncbi:BlaI/MecI/CopY family transcriptional regulator [Phenylobacterium sp.]|uniref:BlaI/MecI/CopY family transcriptional regulator n=1 Tax=Phenylobacterium sp. TaxID=1871053 RepID=UPI002B693DB3|nr:BlaI/MecI/CopY family transcriptional regulator [Phenylobacterium sp.]HVI30666.1 BlaI/MecI/CopY family transcriptional regulator [Phenylobacterium sp.]